MDKLAIYGGEKFRKQPFPPRTPYGEEDFLQVKEALESQDLFYTAGNKVAGFEKAFADTYGVKHCYTCSSGTASLHMAVAALDPEPGGEVITAPVTDFGTIAGLIFQGLIPVFADWMPDALNMDPKSVEAKITPKTCAIIVVHLFGNPCDMDAILDIARRHDLPVIEDCCQAYLTYYKGRLCGTIGDIGCFSMQMSKHLPTGEGGCVITDNERYASRMCLFRDKGWENRERFGPRAYSFLGTNYRMNELTAAVAISQLNKLEHTVSSMRALALELKNLLADEPSLIAAPSLEGADASYWLFPIIVKTGDAELFAKALQAEGVPFGYGYTGKPIYLCMEALTAKRTFGTSGYPFVSEFRDGETAYAEGLCPVAERQLKQLICFRIFENWTREDIADVAGAVKKVVKYL